MPAPKCPTCKTRDLMYVQRVYEYHVIENFDPADNGYLDLESLDDTELDESFLPYFWCPTCANRFTMKLEPCEEPYVICSICHEKTDPKTAHMHQGEWIGDECWDERLKASE